MGGMDPTGMLNKVMQMVEQMVQQQQGSGECGQAGQAGQGGGQDDPVQAFQQILQPLLQQLGQGQEQG
jgi:hypothetical protein